MLAEQHDEWAVARRDLGLDIIRASLMTVVDDSPKEGAQATTVRVRIAREQDGRGGLLLHHLTGRDRAASPGRSLGRDRVACSGGRQ